MAKQNAGDASDYVLDSEEDSEEDDFFIEESQKDHLGKYFILQGLGYKVQAFSTTVSYRHKLSGSL